MSVKAKIETQSGQSIIPVLFFNSSGISAKTLDHRTEDNDGLQRCHRSEGKAMKETSQQQQVSLLGLLTG